MAIAKDLLGFAGFSRHDGWHRRGIAGGQRVDAATGTGAVWAAGCAPAPRSSLAVAAAPAAFAVALAVLAATAIIEYGCHRPPYTSRRAGIRGLTSNAVKTNLTRARREVRVFTSASRFRTRRLQLASWGRRRNTTGSKVRQKLRTTELRNPANVAAYR